MCDTNGVDSDRVLGTKERVLIMMIRRFLPVGQGAFYCEQFDVNSEERVNVIYDCGSATDEQLVEQQIRNTFEKGEIIHAVFISHLDADHINGIPYLLKYCNVKKMFFPLITRTDVKYMMLHNMVKGETRDSFTLRFINNPYDAFSQLDLGYSPRLYQIRAEEEDYNQIDAIPILSGENVAGEIFEDFLDEYWIYKKWIYIPHNFRQSKRVNELQIELNNLFGKNMENEDLLNIWEKGTDCERDKIKSAYRLVKGSFNTNSMTLYSGTQEVKRGQKAVCSVWDRYWCCNQCNWRTVGCLYTGDYDASGQYKWKSLTDAYSDYWNNIGCIQIPHHGSRHNYNKDLAKFNAYYVMSAGMWNRFQHPHTMVIKDLLFNGHFPYIVTENKFSELHLIVDF